MHVVTAHGSVVGVDDAASLIQVVYERNQKSNLVDINDSGEDQIFESGPLLGFKLLHAKDGVHFAMESNFLSAEPGNRKLVTNRQVADAWETFFLVSEADLERSPGPPKSAAVEVLRFGMKVSELIAAGKPVKINCGSGPVPRRGYLNLDIEMMAPEFATRYPDEYFIFPFADMPWGISDNCVDYIFHEDFIEHITQLQQIQFLSETWRILRPGCYHRVNTPNLIAAMRRHSDFKAGFKGVYTGEARWGHIAIFSATSLKEIAELVGYREVIFTTRNHGVSPFAEADWRPWSDRDEIVGNIYADLQK